MLTQRPHFPDRDSLRQFGNLATPIWVFDVDNHAIWWANRAGVTFWKAASLEDLLRRDFSSDSANVRSRLRQIVESSAMGAPVQDTWTLYPLGEPHTVVITFQPIVIGSGGNALLLEINRVLDLHGDEEALRMLEAMRTAALLVSTYATSGQLLAQNPEALAVYGQAFGQFGSLQARMVDPDDVERLISTVLRNETYEAEVDIHALHGARRHRVVARRGRDPVTGDFVIVTTEEDVTEAARLRRQMEDMNAALEAKVTERTRRLRQSEERYELATRAAAIWDWWAEDDSMFVSPRLAESLGYDADTFRTLLSEKRDAAFIFPEDMPSYLEALQEHLKNPETPWEHEVRVLAKGGEQRWFNLRGIGVRGPDGRTVRSVGLMTDVTHRKELETTLFAAQRMEAVGRLTGGVAHDFNNLLTAISGHCDLMLLRHDPGDGDYADLVQIAQNANRAAALVGQLLAFSRKQTLLPEVLDVRDALADLTHLLNRLVGETITLSLLHDPDLPTIRADRRQLEQVIMNLVVNARDAMPDGGDIVVETRRTVLSEPLTRGRAVVPPGEYATIAVSDHGVGIPPEVLGKIFEPFFTTKRTGEGTGLGLSTAYGIIKQSGGFIFADSHVGKGSEFTIFLPANTTAAATEPPALPVSVPAETSGEGVILLVEDEAPVRAFAARALRLRGYTVLEAATAEEALDMLERDALEVDLFVSDVIMPGMDGPTWVRKAREKRPDIKAVFVSGYAEDLLSGQQAGLEQAVFLPKPFSLAQLTETVQRQLS